MSVGANIRKFREKLGITEWDFARRIGVPVEDCMALETGERSLNSNEIRKIVDVLGVTLDDLLMDNPDREPETPATGGSVLMPMEALNELLGKMRE